MPKNLWLVVAVTAPLLVAAFDPDGVIAQEATPVGGRVVPDPSECEVVPRPTDELLALAGSPTPRSRTEEPAATPAALQTDAAVDAAVVEEIAATTRELVACLNAGDLRRAYALWTDDLLREGGGIEPEEILAEPEALPERERTAFLAVTYVRPLADGRVGAALVIDDPQTSSPADVSFGIFERVGDRWLLDEVSF